MVMLRKTILTMATKVLILLAVLSLLPCAAIADVEASMPALLAHIREIQRLTKAAHGEVEEADLDGSLGVAKAVDPKDALPKVDATSQLFAHIYEVQQKAAEKLEGLNGEVESEMEMERFLRDEKEEKEADSDGVVDAMVQARFHQLEATLKSLTDKDTSESMQWSADDRDATNLLHQFVQERQLKKRHLDETGQGAQLEKDQRHEAIVEHGEIGHRDIHGDRDRDHEIVHAKSDLSGLIDAHYHKDDHGDHRHGQQHEESFKEVNLLTPEEEKEVDAGGVMDSLVQERFNQLEAALRFLKDKDGADSMQWNADTTSADDPINLLDQFVQERQLKHHQESQLKDEQVDEATTVDHGEIGHGRRNNHGNCEHLHEHDYKRGLQSDHGDAIANAGAHYCNHDHQHEESVKRKSLILPEEIAEEDDLLLYGFEGQEHPSTEYLRQSRGPKLGLWLRALGCSLLVSLASLICLLLLPFIVSNGKPSKTVVNALASFGVRRAILMAGTMLGDAFLHQLPHAFGNSKSSPSKDKHQHCNDHGHAQAHRHDHISSASQGYAHSLQDQSISLAVLGGILLFFIVEKIVRRYEELSSHGGQRARGHNHRHRKKKNRAKKSESSEKIAAFEESGALELEESNSLETKSSDLRMRESKNKKDTDAGNVISKAPVQLIKANGRFVIGYLNLFSDGVHNFTDGMALGSAFLLHGTVGGWSRTLFLLAHELPQEVGDFGILVKSGFNVFEALALNFFSALVALAGTAVALVLGGSLSHSSLIEGFIAGGFFYMSVGGVMPSMHDQGSSLTSTILQLLPMVLGMGVAVVLPHAE